MDPELVYMPSAVPPPPGQWATVGPELPSNAFRGTHLDYRPWAAREASGSSGGSQSPSKSDSNGERISQGCGLSLPRTPGNAPHRNHDTCIPGSAQPKGHTWWTSQGGSRARRHDRIGSGHRKALMAGHPLAPGGCSVASKARNRETTGRRSMPYPIKSSTVHMQDSGPGMTVHAILLMHMVTPSLPSIISEAHLEPQPTPRNPARTSRSIFDIGLGLCNSIESPSSE